MNWGKREERQKSDEKNGLGQNGEQHGLGQAQPLHSRLQLFTLILDY
jgi:hypothetical protein